MLKKILSIAVFVLSITRTHAQAAQCKGEKDTNCSGSCTKGSDGKYSWDASAAAAFKLMGASCGNAVYVSGSMAQLVKPVILPSQSQGLPIKGSKLISPVYKLPRRLPE